MSPAYEMYVSVSVRFRLTWEGSHSRLSPGLGRPWTKESRLSDLPVYTVVRTRGYGRDYVPILPETVKLMFFCLRKKLGMRFTFPRERVLEIRYKPL